MILRDFNKHAEYILNKVQNILIKKQAEYAEGGEEGDRLYNFTQTTSLLEMNQAQVCLAYDSKHIASIAKICKDINSGILPTEEILEEKIQDYLAYGVLLYANILELMEKAPSKTPSISHVEASLSDSSTKDDTACVSE